MIPLDILRNISYIYLKEDWAGFFCTAVLNIIKMFVGLEYISSGGKQEKQLLNVHIYTKE